MFSFSKIVLDERLALLEVTWSTGGAAWWVVTAATLAEMGMKPGGGKGVCFFFLAWGDSGSNSMSISLSVDAELWAAESFF